MEREIGFGHRKTGRRELARKPDVVDGSTVLPRFLSQSERATLSMSDLSNDRREGLRPPQFRLSTLLWGMTALSILFAAMTWVGPLAAFGLLLLFLSIVAHVAGNAIGTRLREIGSRPLAEKGGGPDYLKRKPGSPVFAGECAPATRLGSHHPLGWLIVVATASAFVVGGLAGGAFLAWLCWEKSTLVSILCGAAASAALGGFGGFLVSSFVRELSRAHAQAAGEAGQHRTQDR